MDGIVLRHPERNTYKHMKDTKNSSGSDSSNIIPGHLPWHWRWLERNPGNAGNLLQASLVGTRCSTLKPPCPCQNYGNTPSNTVSNIPPQNTTTILRGKSPLFSHFFAPKYHMVGQHLYPLEMVGSIPPLSVTNAEKVITTWISLRRFGRDTPKKYLSIWTSRISWCCVG